MRTRRLLDRRIAALGVLAVATALFVGATSGGGATKAAPPQPVTWKGLVGGARAQVPIGQRVIVVLKTRSVAQQLAKHGFATEADERLLARFLELIPVVELDDEIVSELGVDEDGLRARLGTVSA